MFVLAIGAISSHPQNKQSKQLFEGPERILGKPMVFISMLYTSQRQLHTKENLLDFSGSGSSATVLCLFAE